MDVERGNDSGILIFTHFSVVSSQATFLRVPKQFHAYLLTALLLCLGTISYAQDCSELKNEAPANHDELVATSSRKLEKRSAEAVESGEESLKKDLLIKLSEKIIIDVQSGSTNFVQDDGNALIQLFTSETRINSNTRLGNLRFEFCFDKRHKMLFGRCRLDKSGLAESIAKDCVIRLVALNAEMKGLMKPDNSVNMRPLVRKYESICSDFQSAVFLNHRINTDDWNKQLVEYNNTISSISNSEANQDLRAGIDQANDLMGKEKFEEAITLLKNLRKRHNQNEEIEYSLKVCYDRYLSHIRGGVARLVQQNEYSKAIDLVNTYCSLAVCSSEAKSLRDDLRRSYFDYSSELLERAIRDKDDKAATNNYNIATTLSDISADRYKEISESYRKYKISRMIEKARFEKDKRNYWEAYSLLRTTELNYGVASSEIKNLKESIFRKIAQLEIREEKKNRPHLNTFEFGAEALFNDVRMSNLSAYTISYMNVGVSAGVYFKYNFGPNHIRKNYPVRSDLIGVKGRIINYSQNISFYDNDTLRQSNNTDPIIEIGPDGVLTRIFHYNVSVVYNGQSLSGNPMGLSASFGLRIPIHHIAFGIDARYFSNLSTLSSLNIAAYFHGNLHFNRKFTSADKRQVRAKLKDY